MDTLPTVACSDCSRQTSRRRPTCTYCGAKVAVESPSRDCARCVKPMQVVTTRNVIIDRCDGCGGEFYDACDLGSVSILETRGQRFFESLRLVAPTSPASCPGCGTRMRAYEVGGQEPFVIDRCAKCKGLWLDAGEADRVRRIAARPEVAPIAAGMVTCEGTSMGDLIDPVDGACAAIELGVATVEALGSVDLSAGVMSIVGGLFS